MHIGESIENLLMNIVVKKEKLLKRQSQKDAFPYLFTWKWVQ
jgi:hypothetical protein